jgi:hypothetical protein
MEILSALDPKVIVEGGAVVVALFALRYMGQANQTIEASNKLYFNHTNDVITKVADAITQQAVTNQKLADVVDNNTKVIDKHFSSK